jgi:hypothetical protein
VKPAVVLGDHVAQRPQEILTDIGIVVFVDGDRRVGMPRKDDKLSIDDAGFGERALDFRRGRGTFRDGSARKGGP